MLRVAHSRDNAHTNPYLSRPRRVFSLLGLSLPPPTDAFVCCVLVVQCICVRRPDDACPAFGCRPHVGCHHGC